MVRYCTYICVACVLLLASCGLPEDLPKVETVLPKGYSARIVPQDFVEEMGFDFPPGAMWMRCIDCKEDWAGLNEHVLNALGPQGFKETSAAWLSALNKSENWSSEVQDVMRKVFRTYSSQLGYAHIMLLDLKEMKRIGANVSTSGDFLVVAVIDDIDQY